MIIRTYVATSGDIELKAPYYGELMKMVEEHEVPNYLWVTSVSHKSVSLESVAEGDDNEKSNEEDELNQPEQFTPDGRRKRMTNTVNANDQLAALKALVA